MRKPKVTIDDWTIEVKGKKKEYVYVSYQLEEKKKIPIDLFSLNGMIKFPKGLYELITKSLRNSNTYDRFIDKFYDYVEENYDI